MKEKIITDAQVKGWEAFRNAGLLWWVNTILHTFGWSLVLEYDNKELIAAYPARVSYRGFSEDSNTQGYEKVSKYLNENSDKLLKEASE